LKLVADDALNSLRTFAHQFIQFPVALVCSRDVGRVVLSDESEGVAIEDDVNVFRKTLDDLVDLGQRGPTFEERSRQRCIREDFLKRPADPKILFNDGGRTHSKSGGSFAENGCAFRGRQ
jgi:hypothetical protein